MASVALSNVRKVYPGGIEAVKGVSIEVPDGAFVVLVGPSGCGKSTLLRMIAGLETITSGEIQIAGKRVNEAEPSERDIAMVFQNYALYPHMSVYDNMAYGLKNRGMAKAEIGERIAEASRLLSIEPYLQRRPRELSGGQRQRVAMGRAIVRSPQVFLFDEPLSNLDAKLRVQTRMEIRRLHDRLQATSIFVTHDQVEAMTLADTVVVMNEGAIEQAGSPSQVYRKPETRFVATFIGSPPMNMLPGRIAESGTAEIAGGTRLSFDTAAFEAQPGAAVEVGIRPEDVSLAATDAIDKPEMTREFVEELGATRVLHGRLNETPLAVAQPASMPLLEDERLRVSMPSGALHLYDAETGRSLRRT